MLFRVVAVATLMLLFVRAGAAEADPTARLQEDSRGFIVVAVDNATSRLLRRAGARYGSSPRYTLGEDAALTLSALERKYNLTAAAAWPIVPLGWHCVVYGVPPGIERDSLIRSLAQDSRVRLAQPLQDFALLSSGEEGGGEKAPIQYNDPYVDLQRGFVQTSAAQAHRMSIGRRVTVALVDTGVDVGHSDLSGSVAARQDFVGTTGVSSFARDRHGTEVAGVIAAAANNGQGIVGIAPGAQLSLFRACWYPPASASDPARCNSFTLAKALAAVLESDARVVNLSLGGPADPLLEALLRKVLEQRRIVVSALPASGRREGFPAGVPEVLVVGASDTQALPAGVLMAPGRDILTLVPGGRYDFSSGSSIAAAHVSGIVALLLELEPRLDAGQVKALLVASTSGGRDKTVNAETALTLFAQRVQLASVRH